MAALATMTIIVNCDTASEVLQCAAQINAWMVANPGQIQQVSTTGKKITVLMTPYPVVPNNTVS